VILALAIFGVLSRSARQLRAQEEGGLEAGHELAAHDAHDGQAEAPAASPHAAPAH
jgi:hypothetical protein